MKMSSQVNFMVANAALHFCINDLIPAIEMSQFSDLCLAVYCCTAICHRAIYSPTENK